VTDDTVLTFETLCEACGNYGLYVMTHLQWEKILQIQHVILPAGLCPIMVCCY